MNSLEEVLKQLRQATQMPPPVVKKKDVVSPALKLRGNPQFEQDGVNGMKLMGTCPKCIERGDGKLCEACGARLNRRFA